MPSTYKTLITYAERTIKGTECHYEISYAICILNRRNSAQITQKEGKDIATRAGTKRITTKQRGPLPHKLIAFHYFNELTAMLLGVCFCKQIHKLYLTRVLDYFPKDHSL